MADDKDNAVLETGANRTAADWVRTKALTKAGTLRKLKPEIRARAFAVSGIEDMERLRKVREAIARIPGGGSWKDARAAVAQAIGSRADEHGRAEQVVRDNAFQAYSAARYRSQMADMDVFPYLKYVTVGDGKVRDSHKALNGVILRKDDPFWEDHYPPWDFGCRCVAVELTEGMAKSQQEDGTAKMAGETWSEDWRAAHAGQDATREFHHRPGQVSVALDEVAFGEKDGRRELRYTAEDLRDFAAKMEKETVTLERDDGSTETVTVREWMWRPVRERHERRLLDAGEKDGREHAVVLDRDTGEVLDEAAGGKHAVAPDWSAARGRDFCVYHNHPGVFPDLSPADVLSAMDHDASEIGAVAGNGATMRIRFLVKRNKDLAAKIAEFRDRIRKAGADGDMTAYLNALGDWRNWIKSRSANHGTGLFDLKETEL